MEGQTTQWPKEKGQTTICKTYSDTHKTKDRVIRIRLKPGVNSGAPERWEVC